MYIINWTKEKEEAAIRLLTKYFKQHGPGEGIMQSDSAQIDGLELLCRLADDVLGEDGVVYDYN